MISARTGNTDKKKPHCEICGERADVQPGENARKTICLQICEAFRADRQTRDPANSAVREFWVPFAVKRYKKAPHQRGFTRNFCGQKVQKTPA